MGEDWSTCLIMGWKKSVNIHAFRWRLLIIGPKHAQVQRIKEPNPSLAAVAITGLNNSMQ